MSRDFGGWACKRAAVCGGFEQDEIIDATYVQMVQVQHEQQTHLEWHQSHDAFRRAQAAEAHGVTL